jgi:hypothetical protein
MRVTLAGTTGQIVGRVVDPSGVVLPGVTITVASAGGQRTASTNSDGFFVVSNVPSGPVTLVARTPGFKQAQRSFVFDQRPRQADMVLEVGSMTETITVTAESPAVDTVDRSSARAQSGAARTENVPSANVQSLQRRAAGVLPVRIQVPRAGSSHRFVKPLVVDEETVVSFRYRRVGR